MCESISKGNYFHRFGESLLRFMSIPSKKSRCITFYLAAGYISIGTVGCNLRCAFCQNWDISTAGGNGDDPTIIDPSEIVRSALDNGCRSVAFTYNEPTIFGEYVVDIARPARLAGLKTVMVTNGYITPRQLRKFIR
jgi:pyruvate formate lyase activating enzyme